MKFKPISFSILFAMGIVATPAAFADDAGKTDYVQLCSSCHGADATGNGEVAELLTIDVPDLTLLAQGNDGEFPMLNVIHAIDGRTGLRPHGTMMPIWGMRFKDSTIDIAGEYGAEVLVRGRVLSIAYYLESIQK